MALHWHVWQIAELLEYMPMVDMGFQRSCRSLLTLYLSRRSTVWIMIPATVIKFSVIYVHTHVYTGIYTSAHTFNSLGV